MLVSTIADLEKIREETFRGLSLQPEGIRTKINLHMGTCGIAAGAGKLHALVERGIEAKGLKNIKIIQSGCAGLCSREPMVTIESMGLPPVKYCDLNEDKVQEIFDRHILRGEIVETYALAIETEGDISTAFPIQKIPKLQDIPFFKHQTLWALRNKGLIDAESIEEAICKRRLFRAGQGSFRHDP